MRLLLLVFVTCSCTYARRANFDCTQLEVIQKLKDDTTGFDERIALLIETVKDALPKIPAAAIEEDPPLQPNDAVSTLPPNKNKPKTPPQKKVVDLDKLNQILRGLNETTLAEFNVNVIMDLFPENSAKKIFAQIDAMLIDAEIEKAVANHCKPNKCQHPFPKLNEAKADNQNKLQSVAGSYSNRPGKDKVRGDVVSNLNVDFTQKLPHLISTIKYELPEPDAASIPFLSVLPVNFSLPANFMAEVEDAKIPYNQENSKTLNELSKVLRAARSALAACQVVLNSQGSPSCKKSNVPFLFVLDPSNMKAFDDIVAAYDARAEKKAEHSTAKKL